MGRALPVFSAIPMNGFYHHGGAEDGVGGVCKFGVVHSGGIVVVRIQFLVCVGC